MPETVVMSDVTTVESVPTPRQQRVSALVELTQKWDDGNGFCDCVAIINRDFEAQGKPYVIRNGFDIATGEQFVAIKLDRTDESRKAIFAEVLAQYCPFCGRKYIKSEEEAGED